MFHVTRFGIESRFEWPGRSDTPYMFRPFLNNEYYEQEMLDHIRSLGLKGVYVDVGACVGTHTVWFARYCRAEHVYAFEPRGWLASVVQHNVDINDLTTRVTVRQLGLADRAGSITVELEGRPEHFQVHRMDRVVKGKATLIKIDVEGMEPQVLAGSGRILRKHHPVVFAEAWTEDARERLTEMLKPFGYSWTGRVFNSTPTYEFAYVPRVHRVEMSLRSVARRLPRPVRRLLISARAVAWRVFPP